jgi:hypothetical protein
LRGFAGSFEPSLFPLFSSSVPGKQSVLTQYRFEAFVSLYQGSSNTMGNGTTLPRYATANHLNHSIILTYIIGNQKRLQDYPAVLNAGKTLLIRHIIDNNRAISRQQPYPGYCRLASAYSTIVSFFCHLNYFFV